MPTDLPNFAQPTDRIETSKLERLCKLDCYQSNYDKTGGYYFRVVATVYTEEQEIENQYERDYHIMSLNHAVSDMVNIIYCNDGE